MKKNKYHYYLEEDDNRLFKAKIRYIIYGSIILVLAILLFILEFIEGFGITQVLDYFISIAMFVDMGIGIIYIIKGVLLKDGIRLGFLLNMTNTSIENNNVKTSIGLIRILSIIPVIFNISIIVFYMSTLYYNFLNEAYQDKLFLMVFSTIIGVTLEVATVMAMISLDGENHIFSRIDE